MINFPNDPKIGDAFTHAGTIYTCFQIDPIVWNAAPAAAGIADAPTDGKIYGRKDAAWSVVDKYAVGLGNVDNTSDATKIVSGPQQAALNTKEPVILIGTAGQYWRGDKTWQTLDKAAVGLGSVDNSPDAVKTVQSALYVRNSANPAAELIPFSWADNGTSPTYFWGGESIEGRVYHRNVAIVGRAFNADNANAINGLGGWAYRNDGNNPAYLWCTEGDGNAHHLTTPGALSVNWASRVGSVEGASGGTISSEVATPAIFRSTNGGQAFISNGWNASGAVNFNNFMQVDPSYGFVLSAQHQPGVFAGLSFQLGGNEMFRFRGDGIGSSSGGWNQFSDVRRKTDLNPIFDAVKKVKMLMGYTYLRTDKSDEPWNLGKRNVGLLAQDALKAVPEAVSEDEQGMLLLDYSGITTLLVNALNEIEIRLAALEK